MQRDSEAEEKTAESPCRHFREIRGGGGGKKLRGGEKKEDGTLEGEMGGGGVGEPAIRKVQTWVDLSLSL